METSTNYYDISGQWNVEIEGMGRFKAVLPGTLDTNKIGRADIPELETRLTRLHTFEGVAHFYRKVKLPQTNKKRLFLEAERARHLELKINGTKIDAYVPGTLSTPYVFEISEYQGQEVYLNLFSDNQYKGWPYSSIIEASAATDETQTNWNGILGYMRIREEEAVFIENIKVYPEGEHLRVEIEISGLKEGEKAQLCISSLAILEDDKIEVIRTEVNKTEVNKVEISETEINVGNKNKLKIVRKLQLAKDIKKWDEGEGNLYSLTVKLAGSQGRWEESKKTVSFGIREFGKNKQQRLTLNQRVFFLRGEANCCVFPEEGHPPMTVEEWKQVLGIYAEYGVNCMRFHSWCPPQAAFQAADEMGIMMQPELSDWNFKNALTEEESYQYYRLELTSILDYFANHPSFVMLTLGNELKTDEIGHQNMDKLLQLAKKQDSTRFYANSSNGHYGEIGTDKESDFYTSAAYYQEMLRATSSPMIGHLNQKYPSACCNYNETVQKIQKEGKPVFGFEVGQYEILPDFKEIDTFQGVTRGVNFEQIKKKVEQAGLLSNWESYVEATGELALICYREEAEAVLRTPGMSGLSFLGLQDFPGQGTALVGMLNSHLQKKPYDFAKPEHFRKFFAPVVPLLFLKKYTYDKEELIQADIKLANYGKSTIEEKAGWILYQLYQIEIEQKLEEKRLEEQKLELAEQQLGEKKLVKKKILYKKEFGKVSCENQGLRDVGILEIDCGKITAPARLEVEIYVGKYRNSYPIWIYPKQEEIEVSKLNYKIYQETKEKIKQETQQEIKEKIKQETQQETKQKIERETKQEVLLVSKVTKELLSQIEEGKVAYLEPEPTKDNFPQSIGGQFSTDFWSVGTFPEQEGGMGMVIESQHPIFDLFPTEKHGNWQWWQQAGGRPIIFPKHIQPIITVPDSYCRLKHMGLLVEAKLGKGRIIISGMGLLYSQQYPEIKALLHSILNYMASQDFRPNQELSMEEVSSIFGA